MMRVEHIPSQRAFVKYCIIAAALYADILIAPRPSTFEFCLRSPFHSLYGRTGGRHRSVAHPTFPPSFLLRIAPSRLLDLYS